MADLSEQAPAGGAADLARRRELQGHWEALQGRVAAAAHAAGRRVEELTVIAVTKTFPAADVAHLHALGILDIGENRAQELTAKIAELGEGLRPALRWHFIGQLQRNKAPLIGRRCAALHTLDRAELVGALQRAAAGADRQLDVFVQLSLDGDPHRGGAVAAEVPRLCDEVAAEAGLRLAGLMAVPPLGAPARAAFATLRAVSEAVQRAHPEATALSAGMSGDLEDAVMEGATHLRIGTDLLGSRA